LAAALGIDRDALDPLVRARQRAAYAPEGPGEDEARAATGALRAVRRRMFAGAAWRGRVRLLLSPRPLLPRRAG
jgi:hypothetical protein